MSGKTTPSPPPPDASESTRKVADAIAMGLINGRSVEEVAGELVKQGWKPADARRFVQKIDDVRRLAQQQREQRQGVLRRGLVIHLIMGVIWIALGVTAFVLSTPQRDYGTIAVAILALGVIEAGWSIRQMRRA